MPQAILTTYHPATEKRGAKISARCARGRISIDYPHHLNRDLRYRAAAQALADRFVEEDFRERGHPKESNPWGRHLIGATMPDGKSEVFIPAPPTDDL